VEKKRTLLIISQTYIPDPAAVGQYLADIAAEMVKREWVVKILAADRGYDDLTIKYPKREENSGIFIQRLPFSSFGKGSILIRLLAGGFFVLQCFFFGVLYRNIDCILVSTSPPFAALSAMLIKKLRKIPFTYWVMDINPDQMVQLGQISRESIFVRLFNWLNQLTLTSADKIITLDEFMAKRVLAKKDISFKLSVIPLWPLQNCFGESVNHSNLFRKKYNLENKFILMYSGNHSIANPLDTLLHASVKMQDYIDISFLFVGGGLQKHRINELINNMKANNIISLPYQPLSEIKNTLSAADVHVVCQGNEVVGIVHPSKFYNAIAVGCPIIFLGPDKSFFSRVIKEHQIGWQVNHGDVDGLVERIMQISLLPREQLKSIGLKAKKLASSYSSMDELVNSLIDVFENDKNSRHKFNHNIPYEY
jgi:colanic acid biosynthesis glycosyl transferase WcaI